MATVFVTFDEYGDDIAVIVTPDTVDLDNTTYWNKYTYAYHTDSTDTEEVMRALDLLAEVHAIDVSNEAKIEIDEHMKKTIEKLNGLTIRKD